MAYSKFERFKWEVLAETPHRFGLDNPWFHAKKIAAGGGDEQAQLVRRAVLELFDEGLVFGAYATREEGYTFQLEDFVPVERNALEAELAGSEEPADEERLFWLLPTKAGLEQLDSLPKEAFLYEDLDEWRERIERDHPGLLEQRDRHLEDMTAWVDKGGKRPRLDLPDDWATKLRSD